MELYIKIFKVKLLLVSGLFAGCLALVATSIACTINAEKDGINFDLQEGTIRKPSGADSF